jgi:hypothetical protein
VQNQPCTAVYHSNHHLLAKACSSHTLLLTLCCSPTAFYILQVGAKVQDQPAEPATIQDTIVWSSHTFLQGHMPLLSPGLPSAAHTAHYV